MHVFLCNLYNREKQQTIIVLSYEFNKIIIIRIYQVYSNRVNRKYKNSEILTQQNRSLL